MNKEITFCENSNFNLNDYSEAANKVMELFATLFENGTKERNASKASCAVSGISINTNNTKKKGVFVNNPKDALPLISHIADKKQEYFVVISLSSANEVIGNRVVTAGLLNEALIHPREVFADPITDRAASVILAHNHPAGKLKPSPKDIKATEQLVGAGKIIGIPVLDHIIVTENGYLSFKNNDLI